MIRSAFVLLLLAWSSAAAASSVVFVDNRAAAGGDGTREHPVSTIGQGVAMAAIVYVAESDTPYIESVSLKKGQMLIGSAFGLDAVRTELHVEIEGQGPAAMQGPGPSIRGTIVTSGDNVIAGCTLLAQGLSGIVASGVSGTLTVRNVYFKTSKAGFAIYLQDQLGDVSIAGGSIEAAEGGGGIGLAGGYGNVVIDHLPIAGDFASAVRIQGRRSGSITFRHGSKVHVRDAVDDAVVVTGVERPAAVIFEDTIEIRGRRRGLVVDKVSKLVIGGASTLSTVNAAALDIHDSTVDLSFEFVSAEGITPGSLEEGIILDRVHGRVSITGVEGKSGTGGAIRHARGNGIRIAQSDHIRMAGITLTDSGVNKAVRGVRCAGAFDVNSTAICRAALYLRHVSDSAFDNILVDGGSAIGINANNIRDVAFGGIEVRHTGDETFESGVLLQEIGGTITFSRSSFVDNAGSEMLIEQRFNNGRIVLDRCTLAATGRPDIAPHLLEARTFGGAKVAIELRTADLHDNLGSAITAEANENSSLAIEARDSSLQHFAHGIIAVTARQNGQAHVTLNGNTLVAQASDRPPVEIIASERAGMCIDIAANRFSAAGTVIHLVAEPRASMRIVGVSSEAAMTAANGGASTLIAATAVETPTCK
jgi:hypothetical protein